MFVDKAHVAQIFEGKAVALVGSAPSVLKNKAGFIDSHDVVVRVNNYKIVMPSTGKRTDVHYSFYGHSIKKKKEDLISDGVYLCMCKCPNSKPITSTWHELHRKQSGIDFTYIYRHRASFWFTETYVPTDEEFRHHFNILNKHMPTTGFSALLDILSYNPKSVYMTGYDFFTSGVHNVDEVWSKTNMNDPIRHMPHLESKWVSENKDKYPLILDDHIKTVIRRSY